jgi:pimeloyl-ACP methyl ester carboxylesterase
MTRIGRRKFLAAAGLGLGAFLDSRWSRGLAADSKAEAKASGQRAASSPAAADAAVIVRRGYTDCRFGQLHYIHAAPAAGATGKPPLVLLHQNPSSSVEYEPLLEAMGTDREVVAFDTPGNGMSDWPPEPQDMPGYAAAFADGIKNLALGDRQPVDVFGYHTGTLLGAELAIAEPEKVGRLVLSGIPYRTPEERQERLHEIETGPKLTEDGEEILGMQRRLWNFVVTRRDPRVPLQRAAQIYMEKAKPMDRYWWPYTSVWTYEFQERFPLISQPVLILQPHEALLDYTKRAAAFIGDVRIVEMPELDRDVFDVGSGLIASRLREFLT